MLDLQTLPSPLLNLLDKYLDSDESKRRAILAPWCNSRCNRIIDGLSVWTRKTPWKIELEVRRDVEVDLKQFSQIFEPSLPFFPTDQTNVKTQLKSAFPDVLTDAQYWAFVYQTSDGSKDFFDSRMMSPLRCNNGKSRYDILKQKKTQTGLRKMFGGRYSTELLQLWRELDFSNSGNYG